MTNFPRLISALSDSGVEFIIVGGCVTIELFGRSCRCLDLPALIRAKRAAGRPKDLDAVAELEALLRERGR